VFSPSKYRYRISIKSVLLFVTYQPAVASSTSMQWALRGFHSAYSTHSVPTWAPTEAFLNWLAGFTESDGTFFISFAKSPAMKFGTQVTL